MSALVPQEHQIRMRSDERENTKAKTIVQNYKILLLLCTIQILWEYNAIYLTVFKIIYKVTQKIFYSQAQFRSVLRPKLAL